GREEGALEGAERPAPVAGLPVGDTVEGAPEPRDAGLVALDGGGEDGRGAARQRGDQRLLGLARDRDVEQHDGEPDRTWRTLLVHRGDGGGQGRGAISEAVTRQLPGHPRCA